MIYLAGEPDDMWWGGQVQEICLGADLVWKSGPTIEVYDVSLDEVTGQAFHPLISLAPPPGEVWGVTIEGNITTGDYRATPTFVVGDSESGTFEGGPVAWSGVVTSASSRVGMKTNQGFSGRWASFVGTVTVTYAD